MRVLCRNLPPILRVCIAPVEDAHADGTAHSPPVSPNKDSRRWPQLVSPRHHRTEERTPLAGAGAEVDLEDSRPSDEEVDDDDDDDDDQGQTRFRGRDREACRAAHDEAVQQVACVLPFEEEAEVRAVREEEASFLAALGITDGDEEGQEGQEGEEAGEEGEEALEAEEAAIFAQLLHGSSDAPPPRSANGLPKARLQGARPCAAAIDVPAGMPAPSCPLLLSAAQRHGRQPSPAKVAAVGAEASDMDSDEENAAAVAVEAAAVAAGGQATRTVLQRWARTGTESV